MLLVAAMSVVRDDHGVLWSVVPAVPIGLVMKVGAVYLDRRAGRDIAGPEP